MNSSFLRKFPGVLCGHCWRAWRARCGWGLATATFVTLSTIRSRRFIRRTIKSRGPSGRCWRKRMARCGSVLSGGLVAFSGWPVHALRQIGGLAGQCHLPDSGRWPGQSLAGFTSGHFSRGQIGAGRRGAGQKKICHVRGLWPVRWFAFARMFRRLSAGGLAGPGWQTLVHDHQGRRMDSTGKSPAQLDAATGGDRGGAGGWSGAD